MARDQQLTSFGLYLQTARIEKKMSIESLAAETRIRDEVLKRLETEDHEHLPHEVFVKGFIRSYALAVGADVQEALERYRASRALHHIKTNRKLTPAARPNRFWLGLATAVGAVLLVAALTLYLYARFNTPPEISDAASTAPAAKQQDAASTVPAAKQQDAAGKVTAVDQSAPPRAATEPPTAPSSAKESPTPEKQYVLEIKAIEETWLKIIVDDQAAQEMTLQTNEVRQIQAASLYNLLIGNAGGVELKLNGEPVELGGKSGQVVNIQLP